MTITKQRVACRCGHVFDADMVSGPIAVAVASMQAVRCPECGGNEVGLGGAYGDAPPLTAPMEQRARWWRERGETGLSSLTIWAALAGSITKDPSYPYDPDDYRRCKLLLDLIPEWRTRLCEVTKRFPWFLPFESRWDEFDRLYTEEAPSGTAPKLYDLMQIAGSEAERIRYK